MIKVRKWREGLRMAAIFETANLSVYIHGTATVSNVSKRVIERYRGNYLCK